MAEILETGIFVAQNGGTFTAEGVFSVDEPRSMLMNTPHSNGFDTPPAAAGLESWQDVAADENRIVAKILLVDDHPENLLALEATLEPRRGAQSLEFVRASSGREALRKALSDTFAVILLDVQMPEMDGYETAELIRKRPQSQHTPIIFLTAVNTSDLNVFQGYSLGAVDYIAKPFNPAILRAKVGVFVELYRRQLKIERMADDLRQQAELLRDSNDELAMTNRKLEGLYHELESKSDELRKFNEELEGRVADRTKALEQANRDLWAAKDSAERANQTKDQFLAILSHELRTPLTPVLTIVEMMKDEPSLSTELKGFIETIGRNVQLEARLIDDLLDVTRIANGKLELHPVLIDLQESIQETVKICHEEINAKKLTLSLELNAKPCTVYADPARLQQVLWNVLKNAVKFTPEHGSIAIRTSNRAGLIRCEISDSGMGIPQKQLNTIFNAFEQGNRQITRKFGGMGLGLAISRALTEQQRGTIHAESDGLDRGTTIILEIPSVEKAPSQGTPRIPIPEPQNGSAKGTLLLVEDNEDTSRALKLLFERKGFSVTLARSVRSAVDIYRERVFDLVISDIGLPDGDGFEMMRQLKAIRTTRGIAISGFGMDGDRKRSLEAGFDTHLVKPLNFDELAAAVRKLVTAA